VFKSSILFSPSQTPNYKIAICSRVSLLYKLTEPFFFRLRTRKIFDSPLNFSPEYECTIDAHDYKYQSVMINTNNFSGFDNEWEKYLKALKNSIESFKKNKQIIIKHSSPYWVIDLIIKHADFGDETCELGFYGRTISDLLAQLNSFSGIPATQPILMVDNDNHDDNVIFGAKRAEGCNDFVRLTFMDYETETESEEEENYPLHTVQIDREWLINQLRPLCAFQLNLDEWDKEFSHQV
jgi:hypothetical protein